MILLVVLLQMLFAFCFFTLMELEKGLTRHLTRRSDDQVR